MQRPQSGDSPQEQGGQSFGQLGRRELGGWNLMDQVGLVGARPSPGLWYPLGRGWSESGMALSPPASLSPGTASPQAAPGP